MVAPIFQPPPTYAEPVQVDSVTGRSQFNPLWLKWFVDMVERLQGAGTVTQVALTAPSEISVTGSPVTGAGTLALAWASQAAGTVLSGPVSGSPVAPSFKILSAAGAALVDQSVISSVTLTDVTGFTISVAADETWIGRCYLDVGAALANTGIQLTVTAPTGATGSIFSDLMADTGTTLFARTSTLGSAVDFPTASLSGVASGFLELAFMVINGATAGTIQLQFAQSTSHASDTTIRAGSQFLASRIA